MHSEKPPVVSVVIPVFNAELYIRAAILSVLDQTFEDIELFIIDDGSTDGTVGVVNSTIAERANKNITFISRENRGVCVTLNEGLALSTGRYFTYLGADDVWHPTKLDKQVAELEKTGFAAAFSDCIVIDGTGKVMSRYGEQFPYHGGDIYHDLVWGKFQPASPTNLFRRDVVESLGGFNESQIWEDRDLWIRIAKDHSVAYLAQPLASYRVHGLNGSMVNLDNIYNYAIQCLDAAVARDPELELSREDLMANIDAFHAAAYFEKLQLAEARSIAIKVLRRKPTNRLAWRTFLFSLLGKPVVSKIRQGRRKKLASQAASDAG